MKAVKKIPTETIRVRLQALARTVSKFRDTVLEWSSGGSYTDMKNIHIDPIHPSCDPLTIGEWLVILKAVVCHEAWHILWSDLNPYLDFQKRNEDLPPMIVQSIGNGLEDGRIEKAGVNDRPGTLKWVQFSNETVWQWKEPSGKKVPDLCTSFVSRCVCGKDMKDLEDEEIIELLDSVQPLIDKGRSASTSYECMKYAQEILDKLRPFIKDNMPEPEDIPVIIVYGIRGASLPKGNKPKKSESGEEESFKVKVIVVADGKSDDNGDNKPGDSTKPGGGDSVPDFSELLEEAADEAKGLIGEQEKADRREAQKATLEEGVNVEELVRTMKMPELHAGTRFKLVDWGKNRRVFASDMDATRVIRGRLLRELKPLMKKTQDYPKPGKSGRIISKKLWRLPALLDTEVFMKRRKPSNNSRIAFELLVDCSGSMCGENIDMARKAATVFASVLQELNVPFAVTGFTEYSSAVCHAQAVKWGERDLSGIGGLDAHSGNRDGYSIRVAAAELAKRPEEIKVLLVFSDGQPAGRAYGGTSAVVDCAKATRGAEKNGINVLGLYFGPDDPSSSSIERAIYKNVILLSKLENLAGQTARVIRKFVIKMVA